MKKIADEKFGMAFITGATGSGKSTTLAAILNEINLRHPYHVVTLEDPVEFVHPQLKATFNQRELGLDFDSFANGLRASLRQAPKVILVGEMRDRETVEIGLSAAETGHLVLSTLHTMDAGQSVNRIIGMFDLEEERLIRIRLADSMKWIISQRLLPKVGGGRVAALEIMGNSLRVQEVHLSRRIRGKDFLRDDAAGRTFWVDDFRHVHHAPLRTGEDNGGYRPGLCLQARRCEEEHRQCQGQSRRKNDRYRGTENRPRLSHGPRVFNFRNLSPMNYRGQAKGLHFP